MTLQVSRTFSVDNSRDNNWYHQAFCKLFLCVENVDQESAIVCILYRVHIMVPVSGKDSNIIIIPLLSLVDIYILHSQM